MPVHWAKSVQGHRGRSERGNRRVGFFGGETKLLTARIETLMPGGRGWGFALHILARQSTPSRQTLWKPPNPFTGKHA